MAMQTQIELNASYSLNPGSSQFTVYYKSDYAWHDLLRNMSLK